MANYTVSKSKHATLGIATADLVTITGTASTVTVFAHSGAGATAVYFTVGDNPATAVSDADDTNVVFPGSSVTVEFDGTPTKVSLIAAAATKYSVVAA